MNSMEGTGFAAFPSCWPAPIGSAVFLVVSSIHVIHLFLVNAYPVPYSADFPTSKMRVTRRCRCTGGRIRRGVGWGGGL